MNLVMYASRGLCGFSRSINPQYSEFIRTFMVATAQLKTLSNDHKYDDLGKAIEEGNNKIIEARNQLRLKYDFEFQHWPVDFIWHEGELVHERPAMLMQELDGNQLAQPLTTPVEGPMMKALTFTMAHTVGRIMLYPGSLSILKAMLQSALTTGRQFLIENYNAKRFKLEARDGNRVDVMFVDRRLPEHEKDESFKGNTLFICSEGNAGFYEIGTMSTPLHNNYSVLGWNHPGFGESTGLPYPQNEINAFEVVINFAVTRLKFKLENIYLFAWSIGGFPACWASWQYPELKGIILDASFDDVLPLAKARMMPMLGNDVMPVFANHLNIIKLYVLAPVVDATIRNYFNLNNSAYLNHYKGPVLFIRRTADEIIPLDPAYPLQTNRGNFLLTKLLASRFPKLMDSAQVAEAVDRFLHSPRPGKFSKVLVYELFKF